MEAELAFGSPKSGDDPEAFMMGAFPWRVPGGQLEAHDGPMPWALDQMRRIKAKLLTVEDAILEATASGHGVAKSTTVSMLILWAFCHLPRPVAG